MLSHNGGCRQNYPWQKMGEVVQKVLPEEWALTNFDQRGTDWQKCQPVTGHFQQLYLRQLSLEEELRKTWLRVTRWVFKLSHVASSHQARHTEHLASKVWQRWFLFDWFGFQIIPGCKLPSGNPYRASCRKGLAEVNFVWLTLTVSMLSRGKNVQDE